MAVEVVAFKLLYNWSIAPVIEVPKSEGIAVVPILVLIVPISALLVAISALLVAISVLLVATWVFKPAMSEVWVPVVLFKVDTSLFNDVKSLSTLLVFQFFHY